MRGLNHGRDIGFWVEETKETKIVPLTESSMRRMDYTQTGSVEHVIAHEASPVIAATSQELDLRHRMCLGIAT